MAKKFTTTRKGGPKAPKATNGGKRKRLYRDGPTTRVPMTESGPRHRPGVRATSWELALAYQLKRMANVPPYRG